MKYRALIGEYAWYAGRKYRAISIRKTPRSRQDSCQFCDLRGSTVCEHINCTDMKTKENFIWRLTPKYRNLITNNKN